MNRIVIKPNGGYKIWGKRLLWVDAKIKNNPYAIGNKWFLKIWLSVFLIIKKIAKLNIIGPIRKAKVDNIVYNGKRNG